MENNNQKPLNKGGNLMLIVVIVAIIAVVIFALTGKDNSDSNISSSKITNAETSTNNNISQPEENTEETPNNNTQSASVQQGFNLPDNINELLGKTVVDVFGTEVASSGYYRGSEYYESPNYPYMIIFNKEINGRYTTGFIAGDIGDLIPGKYAYSYAELKEIFGDKLGALEVNELDGGYTCAVQLNEYEIYFLSYDDDNLKYFDLKIK
ncbi:MAG: hypothetical protein Q4B40_02615 [Clostridia bacterium]|nr:hypothetical protein [Clostridia bacterium]